MAGQTIAWAGGRWDTRAVLRQHVQEVLGGADVDTHTAATAEFGQWHASHQPPPPPPPTDWTGTIMANLPVLSTGGETVADVAVMRAQALLNVAQRGPRLKVHGIFGPVTDAVRRDVQPPPNTGEDGRVGARTGVVPLAA